MERNEKSTRTRDKMESNNKLLEEKRKGTKKKTITEKAKCYFAWKRTVTCEILV